MCMEGSVIFPLLDNYIIPFNNTKLSSLCHIMYTVEYINQVYLLESV